MVLFSLNQAGYYFVYSLEQSGIRREMKTRFFSEIDKYSAGLLITDKDNPSIKWEEEGEEFYMEGELYDVIEARIINGKTFLYCIIDEKEKKLVQNFVKTVLSVTDKENSGKNGKHSVKLLEKDLVIKNIENSPVIDCVCVHRYLNFDTALSTCYKEIKIPPPRV